MKKLNLLLLLLVLTVYGALAQIRQPVKWSVASKKINSKEAFVFIKATIQDGWHIYGLNVPEGGPISTVFTFQPSKDYTTIDKVSGPVPKSKYEKDFKMNVPYYQKEVTFQQKVKLIKGQTSIKGMVSYMSCDAKECLPEDEYRFSIAIK